MGGGTSGQSRGTSAGGSPYVTEEPVKPDKTYHNTYFIFPRMPGRRRRTRVWEVCLPACLFLLTKFLEQAREVPVAGRA